MKPDGIQLLAELKKCSADQLSNAKRLEKMVSEGIAECGFHQVHISSKAFAPIGVTVIAIISESHVVIHTYPETRHASIDIFHCSDVAEPLRKLLDYFKQALQAESSTHILLSRGQNLTSLIK